MKPNKKHKVTLFEKSKDPGKGMLRVVADFTKIKKITNDRPISFKEIYEVIFGKGRSIFLEETNHETKVDEKLIIEQRFTLIGLSKNGKPILVIIAPQENGIKKKLVTAWRVSRKSEEVKKLLKEIPNLKGMIIND